MIIMLSEMSAMGTVYMVLKAPCYKGI